MRQYELVERVKAYDGTADEDAINRAYVFAMQAHGSQKRASGAAYFSHPIEVAGILTAYKVDAATICTALLHDTIEDTEVILDDLVQHFGDEVGRLVDGVTKLARIEYQSDQAKQAENFRKLVLAMSEDIRVLLVKLADRLHNMRTLGYIKNPEKRLRIARETMEIYAPLAERIGMNEIRNELEDLAFVHLNEEARTGILKRLETMRAEGGAKIPQIVDGLTKTLVDGGINARVYGREKTPYSIWRKMQRKDVSFEQLADLMAFRIIVANREDCYRALGAVHNAFRVLPGRFKDYISTPKPNGYQSIHTCVLGPHGHRVELQIRTDEMHEVAEKGVAAHWNYKQGVGKSEGPRYRWLRELLDILENAAGPEEFLEHTKLEMFQDQVFCFTPRGDLISLPLNATPVDFAYAVHSEVGDHCVGAKINGRMMPLRTRLKTGDQVEIVTSKAQTPNPVWERFVVTGKARSRIRRFIRHSEREEYAKLGRSMLMSAFKETGYKLTEKALTAVLPKLSCATTEDLCVDVGLGHRTGREVVEAAYPEVRQTGGAVPTVVPFAEVKQKRAQKTRKGKKRTPDGSCVPLKGLIPGMAMHFAGCCHPLPGDRIVGVVTTGKGVTVHTIDCDTLGTFADQPERWLDLTWEGESSGEIGPYVGRLHVTVTNSPGSLGELSTMIAKNDGNISNLKITDRSTDFFDMIIDIEVRDVKHLTNIMAALRATPVINSVERARG